MIERLKLSDLYLRLGFLSGALADERNRAVLVADMTSPDGPRLIGHAIYLRDLLTLALQEAGVESKEGPDV